MRALADEPISVYGDGKQTRSFCYITDTVTGLMLLTASDKAKGEVVNVGNSKEVTVLELAKKIKELTKSSSKLTFHPLPKDDPKRRCPDSSKIEELIGWKPKVDLEEGLKKTITWFSSKGYFQVETEELSQINY
jgi:nucleoside-diphosphate-sugar epimerase